MVSFNMHRFFRKHGRRASVSQNDVTVFLPVTLPNATYFLVLCCKTGKYICSEVTIE